MELQESDLPRQELIADFHGYFGTIDYLEFAGEACEASNSPVFAVRIPGTFPSPYDPPKIYPKTPPATESPSDLRARRPQEKQRVSPRITELTGSEDELENLKHECNGAERHLHPYESNDTKPFPLNQPYINDGDAEQSDSVKTGTTEATG